MIPSALNAGLRLWPWLIGVLLCSAAMMLGHDLGNETASLLGGEPVI